MINAISIAGTAVRPAQTEQFTMMQRRIIDWARRKGWSERAVEVPEQCALIHSEVSEALESWRNHELTLWHDESFTPKPCGLASEYADAVIRLFHYAELNGFDLGSEVLRKMEYNETREYRHGGKRA